MSTRIMALCWPLSGLSILQKAVLISLADQANDQGVCWPSVSTIGERVCACERAVRDSIRDLMELKLLQREPRSGRATIYTVTPAAYAPLQENTPAGNAGVPLQEMPDTPAGNAYITVIEPSVEPSKGSSPLADAKKPKTPKRPKKPLTTMAAYLLLCRSEGRRAMPEDAAVFDYARRAGIPDRFLWLAWQEFKSRHLDNRKQYKDWPIAFLNSVRGNWYSLWWIDPDDDNAYKLTSRGVQAEIVHEEHQAYDHG